MKITGLILLLILMATIDLMAQGPTVRRYTVNDGLNQIETNSAFITYDSMIYIGESTRKPSVFDGYGFSPIDHPITPSTYSIYRNLPLKNGNLILADSLYHYQDGIFFPVQYPKSNKGPSLSIFFRHDSVYVYNGDYTLSIYNEKERSFTFKRRLSDEIQNVLRSIGKVRYYRESFFGDHLIAVNDEFYHKREKRYSVITRDSLLQYAPDVITYCQKNNLSLEQIRIISPQFLFPFKINALNGLSVGVVPIGNNLSLQCIFDYKKSRIINHIIIPEINQRGTILLDEHTIIRASHQGLEKIDESITYFSSSNPYMISALHTIVEGGNGNIIFGGYGSGLSSYDGKELKNLNTDKRWRNVLPGAFTWQTGEVLFFTDAQGGMATYKDGTIYPLHLIGTPVSRQTGYFIDTLSDGRFAFGLNNEGLAIEQRRNQNEIWVKTISKSKGLDLLNVLHFIEDQNNRIWCGRSSQGVGLYDLHADTAYTFRRTKNKSRSFGTISADIDHHNGLWLGSNDGVKYLRDCHLFDPAKDNFFELTEHIELPNGDGSQVTFLKQVDDFIVAGNASAVSFIDLSSFYAEPDNPLIYQLYYGEDIQGGGSEQNAVLFDSQRRLWIGSQEGASMIHWDSFNFDQTTNKIKINAVSLGGIEEAYKQNTAIVIPADNRNCRITFGPDKNISLRKNIFFDYVLTDSSGDTLDYKLYDQHGVFERKKFAPGNFTLHIEAKKHGRLMDSISIPLHVPMMLSENPLFWIALGLVFMLSALSFVWYRNRQKQQLLEKQLQLTRLEKDKDNLRVQAIISSFNPHFINNSLHWIQSRYRKDDTLVKLIGGLADNLGKVFSNTRAGKAFHLLEEELQLVQNYIAIQKIRFGDSFEFRFTTTNKDLLSTPILLMHIQIHVENAVEHGLRNREDSSYIQLTIGKNEEDMHILIEDDGVGRVTAKSLASQGTQSGTTMLTELIDIFNEKNTFPITQIYEDGIFQEDNGTAFGTRVRITYPLNYTYAI